MSGEVSTPSAIFQAIHHAAVAGGCWSAARRDVQSADVWTKIGQSSSDKARRSLSAFKFDALPPGGMAVFVLATGHQWEVCWTDPNGGGVLAVCSDPGNADCIAVAMSEHYGIEYRHVGS